MADAYTTPPPRAPSSSLRRVATRLFEATDLELDSWLVTERNKGQSWESMSRDIYLLTDGAVEVSSTTVRVWAKSPTGSPNGEVVR